MSNTDRRSQLRLQREKEAAAARKKKMFWIVVGVIAVAAIVVAAVVGLNMAAKQVAGTEPANISSTKGIRMSADAPKAGAPKVQLLTDYQCPACKQFEDLWGAKLQELAKSGEIDLQMQTMTFLDAKLGNDSSVKAAEAAACSVESGRYAEMVAALYKNQPKEEGQGFTPEQLRVSIPTEAGITGEKLTSYQKCYDSRLFKAFVTKADTESSRILSQSGGSGTPSLVVNGKLLEHNKLDKANPNALLEAINKLK